jgi:hypothetical protein
VEHILGEMDLMLEFVCVAYRGIPYMFDLVL